MFALLNQVKQQFVSKYLELSMYWKITAIVTKQVQYLTFGAEFICTLFHLMYFFLCISKYQKVFETFVTFNRNVQCLYKKIIRPNRKDVEFKLNHWKYGTVLSIVYCFYTMPCTVWRFILKTRLVWLNRVCSLLLEVDQMGAKCSGFRNVS